jgi:hypothetical protein
VHRPEATPRARGCGGRFTYQFEEPVMKVAWLVELAYEAVPHRYIELTRLDLRVAPAERRVRA